MIDKNLQNKKVEGFTLIELVLATVIIGILTGVMLGVINIRGIQAKSRDSQRIGDLKKIQTALELYFADYRGYPEADGWIEITGSDSLSTTLSPNYINKIPTDPLDGQDRAESGSCFDGKDQHGYYYITTDCSGSDCVTGSYILGATMEVETTAANDLVDDLRNCTSITCGSDSDDPYCYGVENPL